MASNESSQYPCTALVERIGGATMVRQADLLERRVRAENRSTSDSSDKRKSRNRRPLFLHVSQMLSRMRYSRSPFTVLVPPIIFRNRANALIACSALLLFHGTPS